MEMRSGMEAVDESLRSGEVERAEDAQRSAELVRKPLCVWNFRIPT